jgi:hypothetical protein
MITIKTGLDTTGAQEDLNKLQGKLKGDLEGSLKSVESKADEAAKSLSAMLQIEKAEFFVSKFGDVVGIVEQAGAAVFGMSEEMVAATKSTLELSQKGAALGSAFGPIGTIVGAALGAVTGYFVAANQEAAKTQQALADVETAAANATAEFSTLGQADLGGLIRQVEALQNQLEQTRGFSEKAQAQIDALAKQGIEGLSDAYTKLAQVAIGDEFQTQGKSLDDLLDRLDTVRGSIKGYVSEAQAAASATKLSAEAGAVSTENLKRNEEQYKTLTDSLAAAKAEEAALNAAILAHTDAKSKDTKVVQAHTVATKENTKSLQEQIDAINTANGIVIDSEAQLTDALIAKTEALIAANDAFLAFEGPLVDTSTLLQQLAADLEVFDEIPALPLPELDVLSSTTDELRTMAFAIDGMTTAAQQLGEQLQNALVDIGADAASQLFDNIEEGNVTIKNLGKTFAIFASQQLKAIGTALVGQGIQDELKAASLLILSAGVNPQGYALAALGAAEIGAGLAMGAGGALLGRRAHGGAAGSAQTTATSESLGAREAEATGPTQLAPVKIYLGPENGMAVFADDERGVSQYGRFTERAVSQGRRAPR